MRIMLKKLVERYLRFLTGIVIYRHQPDIIAIAGITSKTTTKKYIVDHLRQSQKLQYGDRATLGGFIRGSIRICLEILVKNDLAMYDNSLIFQKIS